MQKQQKNCRVQQSEAHTQKVILCINEKLNGMLILMWEMVLGFVSVDRLPQASKSHLSFFLKSTLEIFFLPQKFTNDDPPPPLVIDSDFDLFVWRLCCTGTLQ